MFKSRGTFQKSFTQDGCPRAYIMVVVQVCLHYDRWLDYVYIFLGARSPSQFCEQVNPTQPWSPGPPVVVFHFPLPEGWVGDNFTLFAAGCDGKPTVIVQVARPGSPSGQQLYSQDRVRLSFRTSGGFYVISVKQGVLSRSICLEMVYIPRDNGEYHRSLTSYLVSFSYPRSPLISVATGNIGQDFRYPTMCYILSHPELVQLIPTRRGIPILDCMSPRS